MYTNFITMIAAGTILGISGWFATAQSALSTRVDANVTQDAATAQSVQDINVRLTNLEAQDATIQKEVEQLLALQGVYVRK